MNEWMFGILGFALGGLAAAAFFLARRGRGQADLITARARAESLQGQLEQQIEELRGVRADLADIDGRREDAERKVAALNEQLKASERAFVEKEKLLEEAKTRLSDAFAALGAKALQVNTEEFLKLARATFEKLMTEAKGDVEKRRQAIDALVRPIRELLEKHSTAVSEIEKKREVAYRGLEEQIKQILASHEKLDRETGRLVTALRRPEQRGRWGEMQLRNVVELAGMSRHCDFEEQVQTDDPSTRDRPDMTVHMPGEGVIIVDSKVALDAYLDSLQPDADREALLRNHAGQVEAHYKRLSSKRYWEQFARTPKLVVMFMPLESALVAALEVKPNLYSDAMANHVCISTPMLLVALLQAIANGWQEEDVAANAREISDTGRQLYDRLATFVGHFKQIGKGIERSRDAYNSAIGSLQKNVLASSRRLKELHATTSEEIIRPAEIEAETRRITKDELLPAPEEANPSTEEAED